MSYSGNYINFYNSFGCGRSLRWEYEAVSLSKKLKEDCGHIDIENIIIKYKKAPFPKKCVFYCKVSCPLCKNPFPETSRKLTKEYLEFYKRDSDR